MITNERQYQVTKARIAKFRAALEAPPDAKVRALHPRAQKALRDAAESQVADLQAEVEDYEQLRSGKVRSIAAESIAGLPLALIRARIMRNWTQKELADRLAVAEQQIQRYEATQYSGVSVERLQAVADALKVRVQEVITLEPL